MLHKVTLILLITALSSLIFHSCIKDLEKEGIYVTTRCHGYIQDMATHQPIQGIKIVTTDGSTIDNTVYSESDGSFSVNITIDQLKKGYYISVQPDSLYESQIIPLDNMTLGVEQYDLGVVNIKGPSTPVLITGEADEVTATSAHCQATVVSSGNSAIIECGFVYDIYQYPTTETHKVTANLNNNRFDAVLPLIPNTTYYVRSYARNNIGIGYGEQITITTLNGLATLDSTSVSQITATTAMCTSTLIADGGSPVSECGVCWSTTPNPTIENLHYGQPNQTSTIQYRITNLQPNTRYYIRSYARNTAGIAYGPSSSIVTLNGLPTVTTTNATDITDHSAVAGGNVAMGDFPILKRGVCYSTTPMPTVSSNHTSDGSGSGTFTSQLFNLTPGTTYYYRAYATNVVGTSYGEQFVFVTH